MQEALTWGNLGSNRLRLKTQGGAEEEGDEDGGVQWSLTAEYHSHSSHLTVSVPPAPIYSYAYMPGSVFGVGPVHILV